MNVPMLMDLTRVIATLTEEMTDEQLYRCADKLLLLGEESEDKITQSFLASISANLKQLADEREKV